MISVKDLADALNVSVDTVYRLARENKIPSTRVGRVYRFDLRSVKEALSPTQRDPWAQSAQSLGRQRS